MTTPDKPPIRKRQVKERVLEIRIDKIRIPDERITSVTPDEVYRSLKDSISEKGILQPLQLMNIDGELVLIDGLHRLIAAQQLGKETAPCIVRKGSEETMLVENLILNRQRGKSDPVGEGIVLNALVRDHKMTLGEACRATNVSHSWGRKLYNIIALPEQILKLISLGNLPVGSAEHILALHDPDKQLEVAQDAVKWGYTVEQTKGRVLELLNPDHDAPVGSYEFTESGQPSKVLPTCFSCGKEIEDRLKFAYFHVDCYDDLDKALLEQEIPEPPEQTPPPVQPVTPPQQSVHKPYIDQLSARPPTYQERMDQIPLPRPPPDYRLPQMSASVTLPQLNCTHQFQQLNERTIQCQLCNLKVSY